MKKGTPFLAAYIIAMLLLFTPLIWKVMAYFDSRIAIISINRFCYHFGSEVHCKHGWQMHSFERTFRNGLQDLAFTFVTSETMDIDQARDAIVQLCDELLYSVNNSRKLFPYLAHHPFTIKDIWIEIYPQGNLTTDVYFGTCSLHGDKLLFFDFDDSGEYRRGLEIHRESWEEAVARREAWRANQ